MAGLEAMDSELMRVSRVAQSLVSFECIPSNLKAASDYSVNW